ncbi:MAG: recombinase family protein, partial [Candidatus Omnitrophica bacterium]|nr:recombinase family protein [Candidatus Omnitrophota bacterium]
TSTSAGRLMFQQLGSFAEFERNRISERVAPGMIKSVKQGFWQGSCFSPFGYKYNKPKKLLEIVPEEAKVVRLIYGMYIEGRSAREIMEYLNKKKYKSRCGKRFYNKFIGDVLRNPLYMGKIVWNKKHYLKNQKTEKGYKYQINDGSQFIVAKGRHQAIISEQDFTKTQELLAEKKRRWTARRTDAEYLLHGIMGCAKCGNYYSGALVMSNPRTKFKKRWYRCSGPLHHKNKCKNRSVKAEDIEPIIDDVVEALAANPKLKDNRLISMSGQNLDKNPFLGINADEAGQKFKQNHNKQAKLTDVYLENILGEDVFRGKMEKLREEEDRLQNILVNIELAAIEKEHSAGYKNRVKDFLEGYDDELSEVDVSTKRAMCGLLFKNIKIAPPVGGASASKRISFSFFEPFNSLFSEGKNLKKCTKNQNKIKIQKCESNSSLSAVRSTSMRLKG